jgi:phosphoribosyl 1,2-cyclic phosphate phosphodiesterase
LTKGELIFLGTGTSQGVPVIGSDSKVARSKDPRDKRLRTSALININGRAIAIDCGPDFRQQMLSEKVQNLNAILITHKHSDHIAGLDDIRPLYFKRNSAFPIYSNKETFDSIRLRFDYFFAEKKYPGVPSIEEILIKEVFEVDGIAITPLFLKHGNLDVLGFRIGDLAYITDANYIPDSEFKKLEGISKLVINALRFEKHHSHFTIDQAIEIAQKTKAQNTYLTHISENAGLHSDILAKLPKNIIPAYDSLKIQFNYSYDLF